MSTSKLVMIGLPGAGKTTFLAALWYTLHSGSVYGSLELAELHGDQTHLNNIRDTWLKCESLERTIKRDIVVSMELRTPDGSGITDLIVPDASGESFSDQWESGRIEPDYFALAQGTSGVLVFVSAGKVEEAPPISRVVQTAAAVGASPSADAAGVGSVEWRPRYAGAQVQLVEVLQILNRPPLDAKRRRIAIIISAWDVLKDTEFCPESWLAEALPLVFQYVRMNPELFDCRFYGVSAIGGELPRDRTCLLRVDPSERVLVIGRDAAAHCSRRSIVNAHFGAS